MQGARATPTSPQRESASEAQAQTAIGCGDESIHCKFALHACQKLTNKTDDDIDGPADTLNSAMYAGFFFAKQCLPTDIVEAYLPDIEAYIKKTHAFLREASVRGGSETRENGSSGKVEGDAPCTSSSKSRVDAFV